MIKTISRFIQKLTQRDNRPRETDVSNARDQLKKRYLSFKFLLAANNRALEGMAGIESLLRESKPFGTASVRAETTAVLVNVYKMIIHLDQLAPGKYALLFERFEDIQNKINHMLTRKPLPEDRRRVIALGELDKRSADCVGGKMANLGELKNRINMPVPQGFAITAAAFDLFFEANGLQEEINRKLLAYETENIHDLMRLSLEIQELILNARIPAQLETEIRQALDRAFSSDSQPQGFAIRSSAVGEDTAGVSFAGQHQSLLNVRPEDIIDGYKKVVAGKYSVTAMNYRKNRGFRDEDIPMCAGCIAMINAHAAGVIYSHNPFDIHDDSIYIHSTWGLPGPVVDGTGTCDLFVVGRGPEFKILRERVENKRQKSSCHPDKGVHNSPLTESQASLPSLGEKEIKTLARFAVKIQDHYGKPMDIEWALTAPPDSQVFILQCRPMNRAQKITKKRAHVVEGISKGHTLLFRGGITASPGTACGRIFWVENRDDMVNFPPGAILAARHALPLWATVLNRAAGVMTVHGSFAGHFANVAREFGVPAVFGLEEDRFKRYRGHRVTIDADNGMVYSGRVAPLLALDENEKNLMKGSPVHNLLERISKSVIPLHLLNPEDIRFTPGHCRTLHDITRFVHEKSVQEMFRHNKNSGIESLAAKQLFDRVAMQWWILNIDNGFSKKITGKFVRLREIVSLPMLAIWEGITAFEWQGPPPMDSKGFLSVMFRATANPSLNTGQRTKYAKKNFFIISKEYCSLSSRLGFHFTTVEAYVGKRARENHIGFRFQGGAADAGRRVKRVEFIGELLSDYGFETIIKEDHLHARIKGGDSGYILERLKILGYLVIHTRQLDMVMARKETTARYRGQFKKEIDMLLKNQHGAINDQGV